MAYCVNLRHIGNYAVLRVGERLYDHFYSVAVVAHMLLPYELVLAGSLLRELGAIYAYSLAKTLCKYCLCVYVYKLIFKRGTSRIYNQNIHCAFPPYLLPCA